MDPADYLEPAAKVAHDHPWRCVRWRTKVGMDGCVKEAVAAMVGRIADVFDRDSHYYEQSNARVVTWSDGTQHLFIGDSVVYELTKQPMRRGLNEAYNLQEDTGVASHCAPLDTKLVFRLVKEPTDLKARQSDKKQRKVKMVEGVSAREEERVLAEEEKRKAQGALARARAKKEESAARVELDSNFLEEGVRIGARRCVFFVFVTQSLFQLQDFDGAGGEGSTRTKRPRGQVDEARLLEAKRKLDAADAADADDGDAMELEDDDDGSGRDDDEGPQDDLQLFDD